MFEEAFKHGDRYREASVAKLYYALMGHVQSEIQYQYMHSRVVWEVMNVKKNYRASLHDGSFYVVKYILVVAKHIDYHYIQYVPEQGDETYFILFPNFWQQEIFYFDYQFCNKSLYTLLF